MPNREFIDKCELFNYNKYEYGRNQQQCKYFVILFYITSGLNEEFLQITIQQQIHELKNLIQSHPEDYCFLDNQEKHKSKSWDSFQFVADKNGEKVKGCRQGRDPVCFVRCKLCEVIYSFSGGTGNMLHHPCITENYWKRQLNF